MGTITPQLVGLLSAMLVQADEDGELDVVAARWPADGELGAELARRVEAHLLSLGSATAYSAAPVLHYLAYPELRDDRPWCRLPQTAPAWQKVRWLTDHLLLYAISVAAAVTFDALDRSEGRDEIMAAGRGAARRESWPELIGEQAAEAAWRAARERVAAFTNSLRASLWSLGRNGLPREEILAVAADVNRRHGLILPTKWLSVAAAQIAHAAARSPGYGRR